MSSGTFWSEFDKSNNELTHINQTRPFRQTTTSLYSIRDFLTIYEKDRRAVFSATLSTPPLVLDTYLATLRSKVKRLQIHDRRLFSPLKHLLYYEDDVISFISYVNSATSELQQYLKQYKTLLSTSKHLQRIIAEQKQVSSSASHLSYMSAYSVYTQNPQMDAFDTTCLEINLCNLSNMASSYIAKNVTSIDDLLKTIKPDVNDFLCVICLDLKHQPVSISTCGHKDFCLPCLEEYQRYQPSPYFYLDSPGVYLPV